MIKISFDPVDPGERDAIDKIITLFDAGVDDALIVKGGPVEVRPTAADPPLTVAEVVTAASPPPPPVADDKFVVYHPDGTRRAGFKNSKDALACLTDELASMTKENANGFSQYNMPCMSKLSKEHIALMMGRIAEHTRGLAEGPTPTGDAAPVTPPAAPVSAETTKSGESGAGSGLTAPTPASPSEQDAALAAAFGQSVAKDPVEAAVASMPKEEYITGMMEIAKALGAQESSVWLLKEGYDHILKVPPERFALTLEHGKARIAELKGA